MLQGHCSRKAQRHFHGNTESRKTCINSHRRASDVSEKAYIGMTTYTDKPWLQWNFLDIHQKRHNQTIHSTKILLQFCQHDCRKCSVTIHMRTQGTHHRQQNVQLLWHAVSQTRHVGGQSLM